MDEKPNVNVSIFDLLAPPSVMKLPKGELKIKGLSLHEIVDVISRHKHDYTQFFDDKNNLDGMKIATTAPDLLVEVLSLGTGVDADDLKRVPLGYQVEILDAVWKETVPDIKKVADLALGVVEALRSARGPKTPLRLSKGS